MAVMRQQVSRVAEQILHLQAWLLMQCCRVLQVCMLTKQVLLLL
jgi:hypothetical protein